MGNWSNVPERYTWEQKLIIKHIHIKGKLKVHNKLPTPEQQYMIDQVEATLAIEDMSLTQQGYNNIKLIITGEKTADESVADTIRRYFDA